MPENSFEWVKIISDESAEQKFPSAIPIKSKTTELFSFKNDEIELKKMPAKRVETKAKKFKDEKNPFKNAKKLKTNFEKTAPSVAAEERPINPGSASGFLKKS